MDLKMAIYILVVLQQVTTESVSGSSISLPEEGTSVAEKDSPQSSSAPWQKRRFKRCSCSSLMDKECVYFCHLDIIWINTPERTVPYGLGGPRMKRAVQDTDSETILESTNRCMCARNTDKKCLDFCQTAGELRIQSSHGIGQKQVQRVTDCGGLHLGGLCIQKLHRNQKLKRSEEMKHSMKSSFAFARLMRKLNEKKDQTHQWTHKKRGIWKHIKTTS
ncbi:endothelin-1 [Spea bombifrons]|uniref:endothelin-1 n=1 Tax=Spea bombifrons TaxID=233779 RepID=UPI00234B5A40|nr:endothelin-1 [Spea bombifrons]